MIKSLVPKKIKAWIRERVSWVVDDRVDPQMKALKESTALLKYIPYKAGERSFWIPKAPNKECERCENGLPIPPEPLWAGYGKTKEVFLNSGKRDVESMLNVIGASGFRWEKGMRVLELGSAGGRMIRHLHKYAETCEITGCDIHSESMYWCKQYLSPPFHFTPVTTLPHLPFEDRYFDLIYCGSVFTHIDDLADAWFLELRRVLSPQGRLYFTIHDNHTIELMDKKSKDSNLFKMAERYEIYNREKHNAGMMVLERETASQIFYDIDYLTLHLNRIFDVLSVTPEAYGFQTAVVVARKKA